MLQLSFVRSEYYRVKEGQSLFDVANAFQVPPTLLIKTNALTHWQAGLVLRMPMGGKLSPVRAGDTLEALGGREFCVKNATELIYPTLPVWRVADQKTDEI